MTTRIYIFENRHPKCEHTTQQDIIISIIESKRIASSRLVPLQPRLGSPRARVISRFLSPRRSSFFSSIFVGNCAFVCASFGVFCGASILEKERGVSTS